ncbi:MAG: deoxyribose-phosphate aldolase [Oscillospiraceae bacterium]|nr:deoxyribose-phosphate aldolase [Oscillospiraceae bacterium]
MNINNNEIKSILSKVDHTLLSPAATSYQIKALCLDAVKYKTASVCIPQSYVSYAEECLCGRIAVCTVIGFPNGYSFSSSKCFEAEASIREGANEIDSVVNIGWIKNRQYDKIITEIKEIKSVCGERILKIIIETCLLTEEEKINMCEVVSQSGADFIKTSTGFSTGGATRDDIALMKAHVAPHLKIKAAGGISSIDDARDMIALGASRLGTSRIVKAVKELNIDLDIDAK